MKKSILLLLCSVLIAQANINQTHITMVSTSNVFSEFYKNILSWDFSTHPNIEIKVNYIIVCCCFVRFKCF